MLHIEVFGPGCANCRKLEELATRALADAGVAGEVVKVTAVSEIVAAGVLKTPGLAVNGKLVSYGRIPAPESVLQWILEAQGADSPA
jgi:small redox-active disulfide protein 2